MEHHDDVVRNAIHQRALLVEVLQQTEERFPVYLDFKMPGWDMPGAYLGHLALLERHFVLEARALAEERFAHLRFLDEQWRDRVLAMARPRTWAQLHAAMARARAELLGFVAKVPEADWRRVADHPSIARNLSPRGIVKMIARHDREHREELEAHLKEGRHG